KGTTVPHNYIHSMFWSIQRLHFIKEIQVLELNTLLKETTIQHDIIIAMTKESIVISLVLFSVHMWLIIFIQMIVSACHDDTDTTFSTLLLSESCQMKMSATRHDINRPAKLFWFHTAAIAARNNGIPNNKRYPSISAHIGNQFQCVSTETVEKEMNVSIFSPPLFFLNALVAPVGMKMYVWARMGH
ncbi:hypothetical protein ACJX0J_016530, partial [Zea mays]